jgi:ppGpp synthetase/RelA/SpoT-type nucleotidyltranferase
MIEQIDHDPEIGAFDASSETMAFAVPLYSRQQVNAAGETIIRTSPQLDLQEDRELHTYLDNIRKYYDAIEVVNNWRSAHSGPLLSMRMLLTRQAQSVDSNALIAQRIKRLSSIELKLTRFRTMKLSQMQDIGGCRAIVGSVSQVRNLADNFQKSRTKNTFDHCDDYIEKPQSSGYRGIHLIYKFSSQTALKACNGLKIEIQLRSPLQHAWATAVETAGMFTRQALKSSQGEADWLRFFELMGTVVAVKEDTPRVADTPLDDNELMDEVGEYEFNLGIINRLETFRRALREVEEPAVPDARYFLLELDPDAGQITVSGFRSYELGRATDRYAEAEKRITERSGGDAVLVSVDSLNSLRRAYPNYFLDTRVFIDLLQDALENGI